MKPASTRELRVARELTRLARGHLLRPDAALEALDDDARTWLSDRLDETLAALAPWSDGDPLPTALALRVTRSMHEAERAWSDAWQPRDAEQAGPTLRAFARAAADRTTRLSTRARNQLSQQPTTRDAIAASARRIDGLGTRVGRASFNPEMAHYRYARMVLRHLEWVAAAGDARPSPFGPLLEVWLRGAWPVLLPHEEALVYVPLEHGGKVLPWIDGDPENAAASHPKLVRHGPVRRPVAAERSAAPPAWWDLGLSHPLAFRLDEPSVRTGGRVMPVGAVPVGRRGANR